MTFSISPLIKWRSADLHLRNFAKSGGRTWAGTEPRVYNDAGFWVLNLTGIRVRRREDAWAYGAMIARLRAGEPMTISFCEPYKAPTVGPVTLTEAADAGDTTLTIEGVGADLTAGQKFSLGGSVYIITNVADEVALITGIGGGSDDWDDEDVWTDDPDYSSDLTILPPLRADAADGATLNFTTLTMTVVPADLSEGDLSLDLGRLGSVSLTFNENI